MTSVDELAAAIAMQLSQYNDEVAREVKQACSDTANELKTDIMQDAPINYKAKNIGRYKKGWRIKKAFEDKDNIRLVVYQGAQPSLTHLLEYGHLNRDGSRTEGKPHIRNNEEQAKQRLVRLIKVAISK